MITKLLILIIVVAVVLGIGYFFINTSPTNKVIAPIPSSQIIQSTPTATIRRSY